MRTKVAMVIAMAFLTMTTDAQVRPGGVPGCLTNPTTNGENQMKRCTLITLVLVLVLCSTLYAQNKPGLPSGWHATGSNPGGYDFVVDTTVTHGGKSSVSIRPKTTAEKGKFGSLVQAIRPDDYRGKRIRFSGYIKTENVDENAQLWVRVDGPGMRMLDFSNMDTRSVKGTTDWKKYDLVIDVPVDAEAIVFGAFLGGTIGRAWVDDLRLDAVGKDTPKTSNMISEAEMNEQEEALKKTPKDEIDKIIASYRALPTRPVNLDFESIGSVTAVGTKP